MASENEPRVNDRRDGTSEADEARSDHRSSIDHVHDKEKVVILTKRQKFKRHCGRFWWWYGIALLVLLVILLPIFFKVVFPKIVQSLLNSQDLPLNSGAIRVLSPTSLNFTLETALNTPLGVHIDPLELSLYNKRTSPLSPFLKLVLPGQNVHGETKVTVTNQTVTIINETELIYWFDQVFEQPRVNLSIRAKPKISLGTLKFNPDLEKTIEVATLNHLEGFGLIDMQFVLPPDDRGYNLKGHLNIPNSGSLSIGLGNLTFNMMSGSTKLGLVNVYDVDLKPGDNAQFFDGQFYFQELVPNLGAILDSQKEALGQGNIEFTATGNATVVNGQHIKFIETILNSKSIKFAVPVITVLSDVANGLLGGDHGSLLDIFGEAVGNSTLFEHLLAHWDTQTNETNTPSIKGKRSVGGSLMLNLLRLGLRKKN